MASIKTNIVPILLYFFILISLTMSGAATHGYLLKHAPQYQVLIISGKGKNGRVPASDPVSGHSIVEIEVKEDYLGTSVAFDFNL
jgi:hypothetical protein